MDAYARAKRWFVVVSFIAALGIGGMPTAWGANGSVVFTYDALGRIASASGP